MEKEPQHFQEMQIVDEKSFSSFVESVGSEKISSYSSEWKTGLDKLFVTCLNSNSKTELGKPIKNFLDLFINTSLNHMSIRSCLVIQPNLKLKLNGEQSINASDLLPITFGVSVPPKLRGIISTNSQIYPVNLDENKNS